MSLKFSTAAIALFFAMSAHAAEGLYDSLDSAPPAVKNAWESVYALVTRKDNTVDVAAATLFQKQEVQDRVALFYLTVDHNFDPSCKVNDICADVSLVQNIQLYRQANPNAGWWTRMSETVRLFFNSTDLMVEDKGVEFTQVRMLFRDAKNDVAIIGVAVAKDGSDQMKVIPLAKNCEQKIGEPTYTIGFSNVLQRQPGSVNIPNPTMVTKRWGAGIYVGISNNQVGSTADALMGTSGGPILNEAGEIIAPISDGLSGSKNNFVYMGKDDEPNRTPQTLGPLCEFVKSLHQKKKSDL